MPQPPRPLEPWRDDDSRLGVEIRSLRKRARKSQAQLGADVHASGSLIGKWEKGERRVDFASIEQLDKALNSGGTLARLWHDLAHHRKPSPPDAPQPAARPETTDPQGWEDPLSIAQRAQTIAATNVDPSTLEILRHACSDIVRRYEAEGPHRLAPSALHLRRMLHNLLSGSQHPRQRHTLYELSAQASGLLGYMAVNAARPTLARSYCAEALELAKAIEDPHLIAWIRGTQSFEAYYDGRYNEAGEYALEGVRAAPGSAQAIRLLSNGAARAYAKLGERYAGEKALHEALDLTERCAAPSGLTPCIDFAPYGRARTLANAATAYLALGDIPKVLAYATDVNQHVERADSAWSRALVQLDVATALLRQPQPEVERAMAVGQSALRSCADRPINSVAKRSQELYARADRWHDEPAVREYADALTAWYSRPAATALTSS